MTKIEVVLFAFGAPNASKYNKQMMQDFMPGQSGFDFASILSLSRR